MSMRCGALVFGAAFLCVRAPASAAPTYINVDGAPEHGIPTVLEALNAKGDAIGKFGGMSFVYKANGTIKMLNNQVAASGLNNKGMFTGDISKQQSQAAQGIVGNSKGKIATKFSVPGGDKSTEFTFGSDINDGDEIAGVYENVNDNYVIHGFVREPSGEIATFDAPGAGNDGNKGEGTAPLAINASGAITGYFRDAAPMSHCFVRDPVGALTTVDPNPGYSSSCKAINDSDAVVGWSFDGTITRAFVRTANGKIVQFDAMKGAENTDAYDINKKGVIVGRVTDTAGVTHGFVRAHDGTITVFDVPDLGNGAATFTGASAINDKGEIAGQYVDASGNTHGFLRLP